MILGDQAVVKIIIFYLQKNGLPIHVFTRFKEVHSFRGDEHTVGVYGLHGNEAKETNANHDNKLIYILDDIEYYCQHHSGIGIQKHKMFYVSARKKRESLLKNIPK